MPRKKIAVIVLSAVTATFIGAMAAPAAGAAAPPIPATAVTADNDGTIQSLHYVCAQTLLLRSRPGGPGDIGTLVNGDWVEYDHSITGWSYVYSYRFGRWGWVQSGWLNPC